MLSDLAAWLGRWCSCDPIGIGDGINIYTYAHDNPCLLIDPHGTAAVQLPSECNPVYIDENSNPVRNQPSTKEEPQNVYVWGVRPQRNQTPQESNKQEERSFWSRGGGTLATGVIGIGLGILMLSNPVGWAVGLTAALAIATGAAGVVIGATQLGTSYTRTAEQDAKDNQAINTVLTFSSSPGNLLGGTAGLLYGGETGLQKGSFYGGLAEAGGSLAYGVGRGLVKGAAVKTVEIAGAVEGVIANGKNPVLVRSGGAAAREGLGIFDNQIAEHVLEGGKHFRGLNKEQILELIGKVRANGKATQAANGRVITRLKDIILIDDPFTKGGTMFKPDIRVADYIRNFLKANQ